MAARFEIGDPDKPRGHALLYFRTTGSNEILATYVVVLPIAINPSKYIPPAFAARMPQEMSTVAATALPPIPESMESAEAVRHLAEIRGDDLLDGGVVEMEPDRLMVATHEIAQEYSAQYSKMVESLPSLDRPAAEAEISLDEDAMRWALMSEKERISDLAKLTGQLRYAVDGGDQRLLQETEAQIEKLRRSLPEKYRIPEFLTAAKRPGEQGRRLAELYIERCYKLSNEEYEKLSELDREIAALQ
ncbi:MAG TPA: hypothetical protein VGW38_16795 [Chloroflexota bacterium]|nr:hypothetical protein [Chloroflexota bacterium]